MSSRPRILIAVLNMGLGHATRSLPVIYYFLKRGWEVLLVSTGRAAAFLKRELPGIPHREGVDYGFRYSRNGAFLPLQLMRQLPAFLKAVSEEHRLCGQLVTEFRPQAILSDHCYGMYHKHVPSFLLAHQIQFACRVPGRGYAGIGARLHRFMLHRFHHIFIPDVPAENGGVLSGLLSAPALGRAGYQFVGLLSSLTPLNRATAPQWEALISISGPEPQRSLLEEKVLNQLKFYEGGPVCVVLGRPEANREMLLGTHRVYSHLSRTQYREVVHCSELVVSRPGYSTLMELCALGKKVLLIPTPGQTEQGYLAARLKKSQKALVCAQDAFQLQRDLPLARRFPPLTCPGDTRASVQAIYRCITSRCEAWSEPVDRRLQRTPEDSAAG